MLLTRSTPRPLVMHAGDTIDIHFHVVSQNQGWHIDVTDETTGGLGTIVLNSADGPLLPAYDTQRIRTHLGPPGESICQSFNGSAWAGTSPIQIKSVTFGDGSHPSQWATVSDTGGKAEILGESFVRTTDFAGHRGTLC